MKPDRDYTFLPISPVRPGMSYSQYWRRGIRQHGQDIFLDAVDSHESELRDDPWDCGSDYIDEDPPQDE